MRVTRLGLLVACALFLVLAVLSSQSGAGVSVGIGINLPVYSFPAPPPMAVIPGTYAYFAPDANIDIVFYHGYWYRPYEGHWFRARGYNGPWAYTETARVPSVLIQLPPDYRHTYREGPHIPYHDFNRNWRGWEKTRYWEKDERWRAGRGGPHGEGQHRGAQHGNGEHRGAEHGEKEHGEHGHREGQERY